VKFKIYEAVFLDVTRRSSRDRYQKFG